MPTGCGMTVWKQHSVYIPVTAGSPAIAPLPGAVVSISPWVKTFTIPVYTVQPTRRCGGSKLDGGSATPSGQDFRSTAAICSMIPVRAGSLASR